MTEWRGMLKERFQPACTAFTPSMEAFFVSTGIVALAEMGGVALLLALVLAVLLPVPKDERRMAVLAATLNHACAAAVGDWIARALGPDVLRWVIGGSFLAMAAWMLVPDKLDDGDTAATPALACSAPPWWPFSWLRWATRRRSPR